ncbi:MAG: hypothetical protein ACKOEM_15470, partial [Planctomycetia bacterium]
AANALQRWYFVPDYQCLRIAEDDLAVELVGRGVKLCCADEVVMPDGRRLDAAKAAGSAKQFADAFTKKYPELAAKSPVFGQLRTIIDLAAAATEAANALQRWYFVPDYQCLRTAEDDLAVELVGHGVRLCGADEVVLPDGRRMGADKADKASKTFTEAFTRKYPEIAARSPVYAQLRNLVDLAVAAAWMQEHDAYGASGWSAATLCDEKACPIETLPVASEAETAIHAVWRGNRLLTPIGGGVTLVPRRALDAENLLSDDKGEVAAARTAVKLPAEGWYWD